MAQQRTRRPCGALRQAAGRRRHLRDRLRGGRTGRVALALVVLVAYAAPARATTVVSTSGVPHGDVGDYRQSPAWRAGMPRGATWRWRRYMRTAVAQITASGPDLVLHGGDMVEGRWGRYHRRPAVFGSGRTYRQRVRTVQRAGDVVYPWARQWWAAHRMVWAMGDHEIGDMSGDGVIEPGEFRYRAHHVWRNVWRRHFGTSRRSARVGTIGVIVLDPFVKRPDGVHARIAQADRRWMADRIDRMRSRGVQWVVVHSEIPFLRSPHSGSSSNLVLENGRRVHRQMTRAGVALVLSGEVHRDAVRRAAGGPPQISHGGRHRRASWLTIHDGGDRLELTLTESVARRADTTLLWSMAGPRLSRNPVAGPPRVTGRAVLHGDGSLSERTGSLAGGRDRRRPRTRGATTRPTPRQSSG